MSRMEKRTEIVRYDNDTALVFLDRPCKGIDGTHIQMVGRLICERGSADDMQRSEAVMNLPRRRMCGCSIAN